MAYDLEEQEQLATLKAWWAQYGNLVTWVLIIALAGYAGWNGWQYYQRSQAAQASQLFGELQNARAANDQARVQRVTSDLLERFEGTAYARMAALSAAQTAFEAKDLNVAKTHLQWVIDNSENEADQAVARLRLAAILLDEKAYDQALQVLDANKSEQFAALVADRRGDILVAQDRIADARAAYQNALERLDQANPGRALIRLKLDAIGGAAEQAAA